MNETDRNDAYARLAQVANPAESEGLKKERAILLLWFLRNEYGIDDLDAYEHICDGANDQGVDGIVVQHFERADGTGTDHRVTLFQSKYSQTPKNVGKNDVAEFIGGVAPFRTGDALDALLKKKVEPELRSMIEQNGVPDLLRKGAEVRLIFLTSGVLDHQSKALIEATNKKEKYEYVTAYDLTRLDPIVVATTSPQTVKAEITVGTSTSQRFVCTSGGVKIAVCSVPAKEIVTWPGLEDRTLFELNVRGQLNPNRVRRGLDRAIQTPGDHANFLAYHNGVTVLCDEIDDADDKSLKIKSLSVVNGTQSVVALHANRSSLTDDLRLVVKFVCLAPESQTAREVAIRSNTQTPVNDRNLRAHDGRQLQLIHDFNANFPKIDYETRTEHSKKKTGEVISNEDAAQLICALFTQRPWLAVKRLSLFSAKHYADVFAPTISAAHVVLADRVRKRIEAAQDTFPDEYKVAWKLTAIVAVYLVGQLLRHDEKLRHVLEDPATALKQADNQSTIDTIVGHVSALLNARAAEYSSDDAEFDNFKVDFKNETKLKALRKEAIKQYVYTTHLPGKKP